MRAKFAYLLLAAVPVFGQMERVLPNYDPASRERGKTAFGAACGFCHGQSARGGEGGPDLLHSVVVLGDEGGKELSRFLQSGRPDKGMPAFSGMPQEQATDIATFLHAEVFAAVTQRSVQVDIVTGDAKAGEAFFNGEGKCNTCHSVTGDLKGIASKYDPITLQDKAMMPRGGASFGGPPAGPPQLVTVTLPSGEKFQGTLVRLTLFHVTLRDASGIRHTFAREGDTPTIEVKDPLQGHFDNLRTMTDKTMHDITAYLVTLK